jgi:NAD(P)-binding Rossmann-like domain
VVSEVNGHRARRVETDYLIVGAGALGMTFADQLLTDTNDASIVIVDRHHMPGGHWNNAYPFVRLHQPSAFYGAGSRQLGSNRIEAAGFNSGYFELASGAGVLSYFDALMRERFLPSRRVRYFPMSEYDDAGQISSLLSGESWSARRSWMRVIFRHRSRRRTPARTRSRTTSV